MASANDNEKKHAPVLLEKTLKATKRSVKLVVADSQYSSKNLRDQASSLGIRVVIPFPTNQQRAQKGLLRVDRYFRTHGPTIEKRLYRLRSSVERVNSRLKEQLCLEKHRVRSIERIHCSCINLHDCYAAQRSCCISVEHARKSAFHNFTRKMSRN